MEQCKKYFLTFNTFQTSSDSHQEVNEDRYERRTQVVATRVYFLLLISILVTFLLITCLNSQTITITVKNPTLDQIQSLPANRICPCSRISFSYDKFVSSNASFHQVCSSDFVSDRWISSLFYGTTASYFLPFDFRSIGFAQFQALASFCQLSRMNVNQTLLLFGSSPFISLYFDSSRASLRTKVMTAVNRFQSSINTTFKSRIQLISAIIMSNHLLNALGTSIIPNKNIISMSRFGEQVDYWTLSYQRNPAIKDFCLCTQTETLTNENCGDPSGIYEKDFDIDVRNVVLPYVPTMSIPGFISSCMPVDACLLSSLECFFNQTCVNAIFPYQRMIDGVTRNFTALNNNNTLKSSRFSMNSRIKSIVYELMVEEWYIEESYEKYFHQCAPVVCTYLTNVYPDFLSILNIFIGLLGGLCPGLRLIVLPVVRFIRRRLWPPPTNSEPSQSPRISFIVRFCRQIPSKLKRIIIELNFFKINSNDDNNQSQIHYQRIATRLYIAFLVLSFAILTFCLSPIPQIYVKTIEHPTPAQFSDFHSLYPSSLQCACSNISIPYNVFLIIEPHYHQMCSSDIVSSDWLEYLSFVFMFTFHEVDHIHYMHNVASHFFLLKSLCTESKQTITNSLEQLLNQTFISSQVISEEIFKSQATTLIEEWKAFTINSFLRTLRLVRATQHGNHLVAVGSNSDFDVNVMSNTFILNSSIDYDQCNCMLSPSCHSTMRSAKSSASVPGFFMGCFRVEALLKSTLECFYNQMCMDIVKFQTQPPCCAIQDSCCRSGNFTPLDATRNLPNETVDSVVNKLFVDKWTQNISFKNYFTACAPQSCTYEYTSGQNLVFLVTSIISIFGGLSTGLEIVLLILLWLMMKVMIGNISIREIKTWLHTRLTEKQHLIRGLHIILVATTLATLCFASAFLTQTMTHQISKPSLEKYEQLLGQYSDTLRCPCAQISIPYESFMNLTVTSRHQICSSPFIRKEWIETILLPDPQSNYSSMDFRKTAIGFFQLLASLCELSEQHLTDELSELMNRSLINTHVISRLQLNQEIQSIIDQFQLNTPSSFLTTLQLIRAMINDNKLVPVFETNWQWMPPSLNHPDYWGLKLHTKPIVYNGSCNCGLSSQCVEESSTMPGFMVGCYPLESLLKSTLQCLYNTSCFSLLQSHSRSFAPLNDSIPSQYQKNSTVELILNQLMVEQWTNSVTYENYYNQCAPSSCSYSYIGRRPALQVLTSLLELYGGLVIIMNVVALFLVTVWQKMLMRQRRRHVQVQPM